jgi:hypothetical protein
VLPRARARRGFGLGHRRRARGRGGSAVGLEAFEAALVSRRRIESFLQHANRDLDVPLDHLVEGHAVDFDELRVVLRLRRDGARETLEDRHLAEEVPFSIDP